MSNGTVPARSLQPPGRSGYSDRMPSAITSRIERELGLTGLVDALTRLPASDLRSLLMDVYRTRAAAVTEATIAAHAGALPEVLGEAARLVDPTSPEAIADAIVDLLEHPAEAARLAERGVAQAERFRWDTAARLTVDAYRRAVERPLQPAVAY